MKKALIAGALVLLVAVGVFRHGGPLTSSDDRRQEAERALPATVDASASTPSASAAWGSEQKAARDTAVFAGGCFWCMEPPYDELDGVHATISGYAGGHVEDPSYEEVTAGGTGHREAVMVVYDSTRVTYPELLEVFWRNVDPVDDGGQFCDRGFSYSTAIFAQDHRWNCGRDDRLEELWGDGS